MAGTEHQHQVTVFTWAALSQRKHPELRWLYAIPNGGKRDAIVAAKLKAEGVKPGVLDIHLPVARGGYIGLWIEMKAGRNTPTDLQEEWISGLAAQGHLVAICWAADVAIKVIEQYLEGRWTLNELGLAGATDPSSSLLPGPRCRLHRRISLPPGEPPTPAA